MDSAFLKMGNLYNLHKPHKTCNIALLCLNIIDILSPVAGARLTAGDRISGISRLYCGIKFELILRYM